MAAEVRSVREEDIAQIAAIERECFTLPWTEQQLRTQLGGGHVFLCAAEDGDVAGYVGMQYVIDEGYISNVAVRECRRRMGCGSALISGLIERAKALGLAFVSLEVRAANAPAIELYEKFGFAVEGRRKNYYERPREDALIMTLRLK